MGPSGSCQDIYPRGCNRGSTPGRHCAAEQSAHVLTVFQNSGDSGHHKLCSGLPTEGPAGRPASWRAGGRMSPLTARAPQAEGGGGLNAPQPRGRPVGRPGGGGGPGVGWEEGGLGPGGWGSGEACPVARHLASHACIRPVQSRWGRYMGRHGRQMTAQAARRK